MASPLLYAIGTATTSIGGFTTPPKMWMKAASYPITQLLATFILVWQSGHVPVIPAIIISILFLSILVVWKECETLEDKIGDNKESYSNPRYFDGAQKIVT